VFPETRTALVTRVLCGSPDNDRVWLVEVDQGVVRHAPFVLPYRAVRGCVWVFELGKERDRVVGYRWPDLELSLQYEIGDMCSEMRGRWNRKVPGSPAGEKRIVAMLELCRSHR